MKKRSLVIFIMIAVLMTVTLSGCKSLGKAIGKAIKDGREAGEETVKEGGNGQSSEEGSTVGQGTEPEDDGNDTKDPEDSRELYLDFLNGNATLTVASNSYFSTEMEEYYTGDLIAGREFDYVGLKQAFYRYNHRQSDTRYAFADLNSDGKEEMVIRLDCVDSSFMNWICIIRNNGGSLELTYQYEDGYRTTSALLESGALIIGGSWGAGTYGDDYLTINEDGVGEIQYSVNNYSAGWAADIAYNLNQDGTGFDKDMYYINELGADSELSVCEYVPAKRDGCGVKIYPEQYSDNPDIRECEEALINDLVALSAELVDEEEMDRLIKQLDFSGPEVEFLDWEEQCTILNAEDLRYMYPEPEDYNYYELSGGEYAVELVITTNKRVTDVEAFSLVPENDDEAGIAFRVSDAVSLADIRPDFSLVLRMEFAGDLPPYGIAYTDEQGVRHECTISQSGQYDLEFLLSEDNKIIR